MLLYSLVCLLWVALLWQSLMFKFACSVILSLTSSSHRHRTQCKPLLIEWWENFCSVLSTHPNMKDLDFGDSILSKWAMKVPCLKLRNLSCSIEKLT